MLRLAGKFVEGICALFGALVFSQIPLFMQYYSHQLVGRMTELKRQVQILEMVASRSGKSLGQYIQKFQASADSDFRIQGQVMQDMVDRLHTLSDCWQALRTATVWERPLVFFKSIQWDIAKDTLHSYEPGITVSIEGAVYSLIGMACGYLAYYCLRQFFSRLFFKRRGAEKQS